MFQIVSSVREPTFQFYDNLYYLKNGLSNEDIHFQGNVLSHTPNTFVYDNKRCVYDFTRTAKAEVRNHMAGVLCRWLWRLPNARSREAFDCLFDLHHYKDYLEEVGNQRAESMNMLIFKEPRNILERGYVALVKFKSVTRRNRYRQYTVNATLTCQRFSYFELQENTLEEVLEELQNLKF